MGKNQWIVDTSKERGPTFFCEISIIRKNNEFGRRSYGWPGPNKIIVSDGVSSIQEYNLRKKQAQIMADALNKAEAVKFDPEGKKG